MGTHTEPSQNSGAGLTVSGVNNKHQDLLNFPSVLLFYFESVRPDFMFEGMTGWGTESLVGECKYRY